MATEDDVYDVVSGVDTGRVDPRVGSGRAGSEF